MIVRVQGGGQYRLSDDVLTRLDTLDNDLVGLVAEGDDRGVHRLLGRIIDLVQVDGQALSPTELVSSDLILPSIDATLDQIREVLQEDGLISG